MTTMNDCRAIGNEEDAEDNLVHEDQGLTWCLVAGLQLQYKLVNQSKSFKSQPRAKASTPRSKGEGLVHMDVSGGKEHLMTMSRMKMERKIIMMRIMMPDKCIPLQ